MTGNIATVASASLSPCSGAPFETLGHLISARKGRQLVSDSRQQLSAMFSATKLHDRNAIPIDIQRKPRQSRQFHNRRPPHRTKRITFQSTAYTGSKGNWRYPDSRNRRTQNCLLVTSSKRVLKDTRHGQPSHPWLFHQCVDYLLRAIDYWTLAQMKTTKHLNPVRSGIILRLTVSPISEYGENIMTSIKGS